MKTQRGIGLIEMLIAVSIGLVLIIGLGVVFVSLRKTSDGEQGLSSYQGNQRIAMTFLGSAVRNAGYYVGPVGVNKITLFPAYTPSSGPALSSLQTLSGSGANASGGGDVLTVRFAADTTGQVQGCSGALTNNDIYVDVFSISSDGYLQCQETDVTHPVATPPTAKLVGGPLGSRVKAMNVLYGVDTTSTSLTTPTSSVPVFSVTKYLSADQVTASGYWPGVKTVDVKLSFDNPLAGAGDPNQAQTLVMEQTFPFMNVNGQ